MNIEQVENAISNAQRLMSPEGQRLIESKERGKNRKNSSNDLSLFEQQAFGYSQSQQTMTPIQQKQAVQQKTTNAIRESFAQMPPLSGNGFPADPSLTYQPGQTLLREQQIYQQPMYQPQPMYQQPMPQYTGIDYNALKAVVNECIRENLESIKQSLNENTIRGMRMGSGNKIQFLDSKGNLYEGVLSLKKKAQ